MHWRERNFFSILMEGRKGEKKCEIKKPLQHKSWAHFHSKPKSIEIRILKFTWDYLTNHIVLRVCASKNLSSQFNVHWLEALVYRLRRCCESTYFSQWKRTESRADWHISILVALFWARVERKKCLTRITCLRIIRMAKAISSPHRGHKKHFW